MWCAVHASAGTEGSARFCVARVRGGWLTFFSPAGHRGGQHAAIPPAFPASRQRHRAEWYRPPYSSHLDHIAKVLEEQLTWTRPEANSGTAQTQLSGTLRVTSSTDEKAGTGTMDVSSLPTPRMRAASATPSSGSEQRPRPHAAGQRAGSANEPEAGFLVDTCKPSSRTPTRPTRYETIVGGPIGNRAADVGGCRGGVG